MGRRELVKQTLEFHNTANRAPRQMWALPYASLHFPEQLKQIREDFPDDIVEVPPAYKQYRNPPKVTGDFYALGEYIDEWGAVFSNLQQGIIGEVKHPVIVEEDWSDAKNIHIPEELLTIDTAKINEFCASTDQFVLSSDLARPFERLQFLRGTEQLFMDFAYQPPKMFDFIEKMHNFYCRMLTVWAKTNVDGLFFMDDWGTQRDLLISPKQWVQIIKPLYRDYSDIAKKHGKKIFFHSDGHTEKIVPHLIEIGIDAVNLQVFCIGPRALEKYKGDITFWGEVDRQHTLPYGNRKEIQEAVHTLHDCFWKNGGAIAQCEFGIGANPGNVRAVFEEWSKFG